jgi:hypothetical protein
VGDGEREPRAEVDDATVTAGDATKEGAAAEAGGVFGNLPRSRPGTRSPRRSGAPREGAAGQAATPPPPAAKARSTERVAPPPRAPDRERDPSGAENRPDATSGGLEDLAWAGIAAAAEAATLGIRLANRALEAMRGTSERS